MQSAHVVNQARFTLVYCCIFRMIIKNQTGFSKEIGKRQSTIRDPKSVIEGSNMKAPSDSDRQILLPLKPSPSCKGHFVA